MQLSRRDWLAQSLAFGALGGCSLASQWDGTTPFTTATGLTLSPAPDWMSVSWNDSTHMDRWAKMGLGPNRTMRSDYKYGLAVSAGGKYFASPVGASPINAITIISTESGERWRIAHPNKWVEITQPTFSPDGERIAFVASPPTHGGNCEIWIAPVRGGLARVIRSGARRSMYWPFFSWDGTRVACFRDILLDSRNGPSKIKPEYRGYQFSSLFEYDIATGAETKASDLIVEGHLRPLAVYAPNDRDFLVGARTFGAVLDGRASSSREYGPDLPADCEAPRFGCFPDHGPIQPPPGLMEGRELFEVKRGEPVARFPKGARPKVFGANGARFGSGSRFYGADRHGRVAISEGMRVHVCDETGPVKTLDLATTLGWPGYPNIDFCAISADGEAIAAATAQGFVDEGTRVDVLRGGRISTFALKPADDGPANTKLVTDESGVSEFPA